MNRKNAQHPSAAIDRGIASGHLIDDSTTALHTSVQILREVGVILSKFPLVKPIAGVAVILCEIFEVREPRSSSIEYALIIQLVRMSILTTRNGHC
jgi:hypothetical protein